MAARHPPRGHAARLRVLVRRWAGNHRGLVLGLAGAVRGVAVLGGRGAPAGGDGRLRRRGAGAVLPWPRAARARSLATAPVARARGAALAGARLPGRAAAAALLPGQAG